MVVTFEEFKDRDEVLRKAGLLKGGHIHVTEDMSRKVRFSFVAWPRLSRLVDRHNPELIPLALTQTRHPRLQLINGGHAVIIISDQSIKPASELVFLLDDEVSDRSSSIISWFVPSQSHTFIIKVNNSWLSRFTGWL